MCNKDALYSQESFVRCIGLVRVDLQIRIRGIQNGLYVSVLSLDIAKMQSTTRAENGT